MNKRTYGTNKFKDIGERQFWGTVRRCWTEWPDWAIYCTLGIFLKPLATMNFPESPTFLGNFWKGVKILNFSSEIIFGHLWQTFGNFYLVTLAKSKLPCGQFYKNFFGVTNKSENWGKILKQNWENSRTNLPTRYSNIGKLLLIIQLWRFALTW